MSFQCAFPTKCGSEWEKIHAEVPLQTGLQWPLSPAPQASLHSTLQSPVRWSLKPHLCPWWDSGIRGGLENIPKKKRVATIKCTWKLMLSFWGCYLGFQGPLAVLRIIASYTASKRKWCNNRLYGMVGQKFKNVISVLSPTWWVFLLVVEKFLKLLHSHLFILWIAWQKAEKLTPCAPARSVAKHKRSVPWSSPMKRCPTVALAAVLHLCMHPASRSVLEG